MGNKLELDILNFQHFENKFIISIDFCFCLNEFFVNLPAVIMFLKIQNIILAKK